MKRTLIIDDNVSEGKFPNAIIISRKDAFKIINLKDGEEIELSGKYTTKAKLDGNKYIFSGLTFEYIEIEKEKADAIINKFYYIGQKLAPDKPKK
ncbi:hypothetical protein LF845_06955 [Deferribacterales bacterium Es71-Z0220]|jgi:hypothetical protein|uniref:hypothetical protein n=1 Tax=Deferrivibrio essentukiensis TaxID=2880922 RepID=UPI001F6245C8|nr:hypothetical protein [Deferrivibrio essentukiensis]MBZ4643895.1 hypothetical protein [Deferribacteraceae bacterium]MCB4204698.1 hypothetical protein [Deferrivibrio essentukiensis]MDK2791355.1 hypothetical protein [Deferribacteres bacterium]